MVCGFRPTPGGGGTEKHLYELACGLLARGVEVDVICEDRSFLPDPENALRSHIIGIPPESLHAEGWVQQYVEKSRRFAAALAPSRYSLVHCHNHYGFNTALKLAQLSDPPVLVNSFHLTPAGVLCRQEQLGLPLPEGAPIDRAVALMEETVAQLSDHCVAVSRGVAQEVHEIYGVPRDRVSVIYNWYDDEVFYPRDQRQARDELGLAVEKQYLVYVGHFHNQRGAILAAALALIPDDVTLIAIHPEAEGDLTGELAPLRERVLCPGYVPPDRLALYFAAADLQCFPPVYGGFGLVLVEGMACGCPPVAFDYPAMNEIITEASGYLVREPTAAAYAATVVHALAEGGTKRSAAMTRARDFDMDAQIDKVLALYRSLRPSGLPSHAQNHAKAQAVRGSQRVGTGGVSRRI